MASKNMKQAREVVQWLGALAALAEELDSILSTHTAANNHVQLQFFFFRQGLP